MSENPDAIGPGEVDAGTEDAHRPEDEEDEQTNQEGGDPSRQ